MNALEVCLRYKKLILSIHIILFLGLLPGIFTLKNDNAPEVFFTDDAESLLRYQRFQDKFGIGRALRITAEGPAIWTAGGLLFLGELENTLTALRGVKAAVGLKARHSWKLWQWPPADIPSFRREIIEDGLETGAGWLSKDGTIVTLLVLMEDLAPAARQTLLRKIEAQIAQAPAGIESHLSGLPVLHLEMNRSLGRMASFFLPLLLILAMAILAFVFRQIHFIVIPLGFVAVCQGILFGIMGYLEIHLNLVNIILAPILFVICLATAVHILMAYRRSLTENSGEQHPVIATYRLKAKPVIWTGVTTLTAFGSLAFSNNPPVRTLGIWSAAGIFIMTIMVFSLYPIFLSFSRGGSTWRRQQRFERFASLFGSNLASLAVIHRRKIWFALALFSGIALIGLQQLHVEDNLGRYLPPLHPARMELERLESGGIGVFAAELVISRTKSLLKPEAQLQLSRLAAQLRAEPLVRGVMSSGDLVESAIRYILVEGKVTDSIRWLSIGLLQTSPDSRELFHALVTPDGGQARVTLLLPMLSFDRAEPLFDRIIAIARDMFPGSDAHITGQYPLILQAQSTLLRGLTLSLFITLCCVALVFFLLIRSVRLTIRLLIPNIWPIIMVFGGMGLLGVPVDSVSVMTASIVLGLAVDDTLHTMSYFLAFSAESDPKAAIVTTLQHTAPAHILTSVILSSGFAACYFSDLLPVSRMGILSAIAILLALLGDLVIIPSLFGQPRSLSNRK